MLEDITPLEDDELDETTETAYTLCVGTAEEGSRLDVFVTGSLGDKTRSFVQKLIDNGRVTVDGRQVKANFRLNSGDTVSVLVPAPKELAVAAENIPLNIVYEDEYLLVVNKPQGMVVHPAAGNSHGTLVNALLYHCTDLSGINGVLRPGIVHRIDKDTSGLLVVAKTDQAHFGLAQQLQAHSMTRKYLAVVHGMMPEAGGTIDAPIGRDPKDRKRMAVEYKHSKSAVTHYQVLERFKQFTYVECRLETGRTHQIRVHMAYIDHPVAGDPVYGPRKSRLPLAGQALHAATLGFIHPIRQEYLEFNAPLPGYFEAFLHEIDETKVH